MKKLLALFLSCLLLSACGAEPAPLAPAALERVSAETSSGVIFTYNGKEYDLRERESSVNALMGETYAGDMIVVEGHINPHNAYYGIFDTESEVFVRDIVGTNFTWRDDDVTTAVYSLWSAIYDYDGRLLDDLELEEGDFIRSLTWVDSKRLSVDIFSGTSDTSVVLELEN